MEKTKQKTYGPYGVNLRLHVIHYDTQSVSYHGNLQQKRCNSFELVTISLFQTLCQQFHWSPLD